MGPRRPGTRSRTTLLVALLLAISLAVNGCANRREVQDINIITAMGIDRVTVDGKPKFLVTILSARPTPPGSAANTGGGMGTPSRGITFVISGEGDTVFDAGRNLNLRSSRQIFLSHVLVIVFGEQLAAEGVGEAVDFLFRHKDLRERAFVAVTRGLARDVLMSQPEIETTASMEMFEILQKNKTVISKTIDTNLFQLSYALLNPGIEAAVPNIKLFMPPETISPIRSSTSSETGQSSPGGQTGGKSEPQAQNQTFTFSGAAVFLGDRLVGRMDEEETEGMEIIRNQAKGGILTVAFDGPNKNTSYLYRDLKAEVKPVVGEDGSISFEVTVKGRGELQEEKNAVIQVEKEDIKRMEELVDQEAERICMKAVQRAQLLGADVLGFGDRLRRAEPKAWKGVKEDWTSIFPTVPVRVRADLRVEHIGIISEPFQVQ
ncbi:MAG: Ger(x)C family spore germination protein [Firmicutes bacterium]|nr:Ger(x)C family spore germination protein [Bacillota bacterium]